MTAGLLLAVILGAAPAQATHVRVQTPLSKRDTEHVEPAELSAIDAGQFDRRAVRTRGTLVPLEYPTYWQLTEGGARVAVLVVPTAAEAARTLAGRRVEVVGLVRALPQHQQAFPGCGPESLCDDPDLPPLPDLDTKPGTWPHASITIWQAMDIGPLDFRRRGGSETGRLGAFLSGTPGDKPVTVLGRFCGAAPCGGLSAPAIAGAWAIQDGDDAVWVIGKEPRGKGFRLDPAYAGDRTRWLEVTGRLERCGPDWCLRARDVALARPMASPEE